MMGKAVPERRCGEAHKHLQSLEGVRKHPAMSGEEAKSTVQWRGKVSLLHPGHRSHPGGR